ncbi:MAG TPA: peptidase dimerization domain-containing protein [Spirochaetia bacterium]|nr:peptidase dimerization domain-containing protein [Spirochaetia bacterium]
MENTFQHILDRLPQYEKQIGDLMEIILANLVMISEIPAPTFEEGRRMEFLLERFSEYQLQNTSTDEVGNALGILPGTVGERNILVVAHLDTAFSQKVDHTITVQPEYVLGAGIGDNSLGVAAVATLPLILEQLGVELRSNLVLMGSARSLGKGNIEGIRFFLNNKELLISTGICLEGVKLGRLSYSSLGVIRGEISCRVPEEYDWSRFGASGAIVNINEVINRIVEIPIPRRPRTTVVFNSVQAGSSSNAIPTQGALQFEVRSESGAIVRRLGEQIADITAEVSSQSGAEVWVSVFARRDPGGVAFAHPLAARTREIMKALQVNPRISPSTSELSAFIDQSIPAVTIGITDGEYTGEENERVEIAPIAKGMAQLVGLILAIDQGYCDDEPG